MKPPDAVSEILADNSSAIKFQRIALGDKCVTEIGSQDNLRDKCGLSVEAICEKIKEKLKKN